MRRLPLTILSASLAVIPSTVVQAQQMAQEDALPRLDFGECPFDASSIDVEGVRCGYLIVPESRGMDSGRTLRLAVAIAEPPGATGDPVVLLPGGPGEAPLPGFIERLRQWVPPNRTLVVFDPRGTGYSGPVMCPELGETTSAIAALDLTTEQAALLQRGAYLACRDRLLRQGIDLGAYNSTTVALDLEDLREALGYERWTIMSGSYGVPFARSAMRVDSAGIRSAVLAIGPGPVITDLLRRDVPFFARALERVFRGCAAEATCAEGFPALEGDFYGAYESLREEPLSVSVDPEEFHGTTFTVNAQDFVRMIYWELTSETAVTHLPGLIGVFRDRDEGVVRQMVERGYGGLLLNSSRMGTSVLCYDAHTPESRRPSLASQRPPRSHPRHGAHPGRTIGALLGLSDRAVRAGPHSRSRRVLHGEASADADRPRSAGLGAAHRIVTGFEMSRFGRPSGFLTLLWRGAAGLFLHAPTAWAQQGEPVVIGEAITVRSEILGEGRRAREGRLDSQVIGLEFGRGGRR